MNHNILNQSLESILLNYQGSFAAKEFDKVFSEADDLMLVFGLSQDIKSQNRQYWGRELGMCWQRLVTELCRQACSDFNEAIRDGHDELCDLVVGHDAIDTKYRIGSGDSGTLKKFRQYGKKLKSLNFRPVLLILRNDNLPAAINACKKSGWHILTGDETYQYVFESTGFDLKTWLRNKRNSYKLT